MEVTQAVLKELRLFLESPDVISLRHVRRNDWYVAVVDHDHLHGIYGRVLMQAFRELGATEFYWCLTTDLLDADTIPTIHRLNSTYDEFVCSLLDRDMERFYWSKFLFKKNLQALVLLSPFEHLIYAGPIEFVNRVTRTKNHYSDLRVSAFGDAFGDPLLISTYNLETYTPYYNLETKPQAYDGRKVVEKSKPVPDECMHFLTELQKSDFNIPKCYVSDNNWHVVCSDDTHFVELVTAAIIAAFNEYDQYEILVIPVTGSGNSDAIGQTHYLAHDSLSLVIATQKCLDIHNNRAVVILSYPLNAVIVLQESYAQYAGSTSFLKTATAFDIEETDPILLLDGKNCTNSDLVGYYT